MSGPEAPAPNVLQQLWQRVPGVIRNAPPILTATVAIGLPTLALIVWTQVNQATTPQTERWVDLSAKLIMLTEPHPGPNDPGRCIHAIYAVFPDVSDASGYRGNVHGTSPAHDVPISGPPFPADAANYYGISTPADPMTHRVFVGGGSDGQGCTGAGEHLALFSIESAQAHTKRPSIGGKIVDLDARPVAGREVAVYKHPVPIDTPCAADPRPEPEAVARTGSDGTYEVYVEPGDYEVCPTDAAPFEPALLDISNEFVEHAIANFVLEGYRLSGTVTDGDGAGVADVAIAVQPRDPGDTPGTAHTDKAGAYEIWLGPGVYDVSARLDTIPGDPAKVVADLQSDDATANFTLTVGPITVALDDPVPISAGEFGFSATATDVYGDKLTYAWDFGDKDTSTEIVPTHAFAKPGPYTVSLVVANEHGQRSDPATLDLEVLAPELAVDLHGVSSDSIAVDVDGTAEIEVTISAGEGLGPLRLDLAPGWLTTSAGVALVDVPDRPAIPAKLTLEPGTSKTFPLTVKGLAAGPFDVKAAVAGLDAADRPVAGEAKAGGQVGSPLKVSMAFEPEESSKLALKLIEEPDANGDGLPDGYHFDAQVITLIVTVTNTTADPITNVSLVGTQAGALNLAVREGAAPAPFPVELVDPIPEAALGTIAPGEPVKRTYKLKVSNGGDFDITTLARGDLAGVPVEGPGGARLTVTTDVALVMEVSIAPGLQPGPRIDEGQMYRVDGRLVNVTADETIDVLPLRMGLTGNGLLFGPDEGVAALVTRLLAYLEGDAAFPQWLVAPTIAPANDAHWNAWVATQPLAVSQAFAERKLSITSYQVRATSATPGTEPTLLDPSRIRIVFGKGKWVGPDEMSHLRVEVTPALPRPLLLDPDLAMGLVAAEWSYNAVTAIPRAVARVPGFLWDVGKVGVSLVSWDSVKYVWDTVNSAEYLILLWTITPPDQRNAAIAQATLEEFPFLAYLTNEERDGAKQQIADGVYAFFNRVGAWFDRAGTERDEGDMLELVGMLSEPQQKASDFVADWYVGEAVVRVSANILRLGPQLLRAAKAGEGASAEAEAASRVQLAVEAQARYGNPREFGIAPEVGRILQGTELATQETAAKLMGMDAVTFQNALRMTDVKNGGMPIVMAFRARTFETLDWLNTKLGITLKPFGMNVKNADAYDVLVGGYRGGPAGYGAGDIGSLVLAEPLTWDVVSARLASFHLSPAETALVRERWATRWEEWYGVKPPEVVPPGWAERVASNGKVSLVEDLKRRAPKRYVEADGTEVFEGTFDVPVDGEIHWLGNVDTEAAVLAGLANTEKRAAVLQLKRVANPPDNALFGGAREYYEVWLDGKRVGGDMDLVHVGHYNGQLLSADEAAIAAKNAANLVGAQHWASSSSPGYRQRYITQHLWNPDPALRGEPLLIVSDGRAEYGYFLEYFELGEQPVFVNLKGAVRAFDTPAITDPTFQRLTVPAVPVQGYQDPVRSLQVANGISAGPGQPPTVKVLTSRGPAASILRLAADRSIQEWTPGGTWRDVTVAQVADGPNGSVPVAVTTGLTADVPKGSTTLPVFGQGAATAARGPSFGTMRLVADAAGDDTAAWFKPGDRVVINPGGKNQEEATVTRLGSLILAAPTAFDHQAGESVSLLPAAADPVLVVGAGLAIIALAGAAFLLVRRRSRAAAPAA